MNDDDVDILDLVIFAVMLMALALLCWVMWGASR